MARRGFSAKLYYAYNPFPPGFTVAAVRERAKLEPRDGDETVEAFPCEKQFSFGGDGEWISLAPGEHMVLRGVEDAQVISEIFRDLDCIVILEDPPGTSPAALLQGSISALRGPADFFRARGKRQAVKMMQEAKIPREERDEYRQDFHPYFENQARYEIISEHITKLRAELAQLQALPKEDDESTESSAPRACFNKVPAPSARLK